MNRARIRCLHFSGLIRFAVDLHQHPFAGRQPVEVTIGLYITNLA